MELVLGLVGVAVGFVIGWLIARLRSDKAMKVAIEATGRAQAAQSGAEARLDEQLRSFQNQLAYEREQAALQLATARREAAERLDEVKEDHKKLSDDFEALASKVLQNTSKSLLAQADERFKRAHERSDAELAKREEAVKQLVEPLRQSLGEVKNEVTNAEKARIKANAELAEQMTQMRTASDLLRTETTQLVTALRAPQVRGRWGELQLRRVVEAAGMLHRVDFEEQMTFETDSGQLRPDLVVNLPGNKHVIVDAKTPFSGYLEAMEAADDKKRSERLKAHARHVGDHIDQLGAKSYWEQLPNTPEFVVMFIPAETFLQAALEEEPELLERAFANNVVLATPTTLVALLRTVAYTWRQEQLAGEAQQVLTVGRELHKRLGTLGGHLKKLSTRINSLVTTFNDFNSSLDRNVVTQAKRFSELQGIETPIEAPPPLEVLAVPAQKPELYDASGVDETNDTREVSNTAQAPDTAAANDALEANGLLEAGSADSITTAADNLE